MIDTGQYDARKTVETSESDKEKVFERFKETLKEYLKETETK